MQSIDLSQISAAERQVCAQISEEAQVDLKDCYQCGKCTAGCPLAEGMDLMPREIIRYLQLGAAQVVLDAKTPWICAQCDVCSIMRAVRLASKHAGKQPVREADIFDETFIANVKSHGVSNEQYLAAAYNLKSGHLMQDAGNAVRMLKRKMVGVAVHNTEGRSEVAALVDRALAADAKRRADAKHRSDAAMGEGGVA